MLLYFFVLAVFMGIMSFVMFDPIKSSFFLIFSLLLSMPLISMFSFIWFSYFICLLFLSGVFVILVYFSSLSKLVFIKSNLVWVLIIMSYLNYYYYYFDYSILNMKCFYFSIYLYILLYILLVLVCFMNFSSYFLSFSGALRKF
uniref:NADH dehydrogenase subunit 6 n=1 Tax=Allodiplogaster sp. MY-2022 TaxID=2938886 RepID=UPI00208FA8BF|nr:NADH dehydrogenase subunit 6 [Allodiplogaster sp. MY-2022]URY63361.1 NADH dehydrogenase subunit 6 [Allodiplogaster sp. MY-2022]